MDAQEPEPVHADEERRFERLYRKSLALHCTRKELMLTNLRPVCFSLV